MNKQIYMEFEARGKNKYITDFLKSSGNYAYQLLLHYGILSFTYAVYLHVSYDSLNECGTYVASEASPVFLSTT
jgi:hypothetical protein